MRSLKVNTAAAVPILTTAEATTHLKVDTTADDTYIDSLVLAATASAEMFTNRYFINTTVTQYNDHWREIETLYKSNVSSITHIKYYDSDNSLQTLASSVYLLDDSAEPARVSLDVSQDWPTIAGRKNAIEVKYIVGYGAAGSDVPDGIKQAVLLIIGNWYQNRQSVVTGTIATELPLNSQYLLEQYKVLVC